jgi:hypothetical protein
MKKFILLVFASIAFTNIYAQRLSFIGIQLGQSEEIVDRMLRQKGFKYLGINNVMLTKMYNGRFWKYEDTTINTEVENGKVTGIRVGPSHELYTKMSDFDNLVRNLDKKYGRHYLISNFFKYSDLADDKGFYWKNSGGYIIAYYVKNPVTNKIVISMRYLDKTNKLILLEQGCRRNTNDDL